jgi:hypothetical protein
MIHVGRKPAAHYYRLARGDMDIEPQHPPAAVAAYDSRLIPARKKNPRDHQAQRDGLV